jgi:aminopeptidase N
MHDVYQRFKYQNIMTEDLVAFVNEQLGRDFTPIFDQYLRRTAIPTLELAFHADEGTLSYRWVADERGFDMPIRIGSAGAWQIIEPTTDWKTLPTALTADTVQVATDLYYVDVKIR